MSSRQPLPAIDAEVLNEACARLGVRLAILFGSHATGSPPPADSSDVDVALALERTAARRSLWEYHAELQPAFPGQELDLVLISDADPLFRWEILRAGVLLKGDPVEHLELRAFAHRDFVDSADLRALEGILSERKLARIREQNRAAS